MRDVESSNGYEGDAEDLEVTAEESANVSGGSPTIQPQDLSLTKQQDVASPKLT
jgi:type VI protein secretion system component Hcp